MIPGINDRASRRSQQGGEIARRLPAQHHAADLRARARHRVRPQRPARPVGAGAEGAAGQLRRRDEHDAALPPVPRRRRGLLGEDRSAEFTTDKIMEMEVNYDLDTPQGLSGQGRGGASWRRSRPRTPSWQTLAGESERHQDPDRGRDQGQRPHQRAFRPRQGVPDLRTQRPRAPNSSAIAEWICTARAAMAKRTASRPSSAPSTTAPRCSSPRSAVVRRTADRRPASSLWINTRFEFIEQSAIAYFKDYLGRVNRGDIQHIVRGDADIRQGAFIEV